MGVLKEYVLIIKIPVILKVYIISDNKRYALAYDIDKEHRSLVVNSPINNDARGRGGFVLYFGC